MAFYAPINLLKSWASVINRNYDNLTQVKITRTKLGHGAEFEPALTIIELKNELGQSLNTCRIKVNWHFIKF